ncbi:histidine phosphatase family protein [Neobacillus pocheonensis]|uniref:Histidine phosphatase family protein n=1 Tax=Neobacillus pocheonensis TaxID=363869 RepID=A0ABT0W9L4_9BACI|nr:histidine phosphatase family protein [Neobacillus pocheonensis]
MKIVLVRHGETNENAAHCYLGHFDAELNDNGRKQLSLFTEKLKQVTPIDSPSLYSSDLSRAMESAQIIGGEIQLRPVSEFPLRELNFGDWEGKTYDDIFLQDQKHLEMWIQDPFTVAPPNGETLQQLGKRFDDWLDHQLLNINQNKTIIMVSHGGPIRWFLSKWVKGDAKEFWNVEGVGHGKGIIVDFNEQKKMFTLLNKL